jgi:NADPH2:quinone reductase
MRRGSSSAQRPTAVDRRQAHASSDWPLVRSASASQARLYGLGGKTVAENVEGEFDLVVDAVRGPVFGLSIEHVAPRGLVVNIATQGDDDTVTFRAARFERAKGARIYTLNLFDELNACASGASDLGRLVRLVADGRLDGQVELECSWRQYTAALDALLRRRVGGKVVLHIDQPATA